MLKLIKISAVSLGAVLLLVFVGLPLRAQTEETTDQLNEQQAEHQQSENKCQQRQQAVDRRANNIEKLTTKQLEFLNGSFERLQDYVGKNNVDVNNYQALRDKVSDAQAKTIDAINSLKSTTPQLDCSHDDHRSDIKAYKERSQAAVEALKDYRKALRDLIKATREAGGELQ